MRIKFSILSVFIFFVFSCKSQIGKEIYKSENLIIKQLTEKTFVHISYLKTQDFGNVACNGMIYINENEAMVFDTPTDNNGSKELINWLKNNKEVNIRGVVATHFHDDCLGGLSAFHENNIPSYASKHTIILATQQNVEVPENNLDFDNSLELNGEKVSSFFFGEGHTKDNIVCYIPSEKVLFGGCLIKEINATKGYLGDANTAEWSNTVLKLKKNLPDVKYIIPGHGKTGSTELLNYTIELFKY